jgi:hypothetical protein
MPLARRAVSLLRLLVECFECAAKRDGLNRRLTIRNSVRLTTLFELFRRRLAVSRYTRPLARSPGSAVFRFLDRRNRAAVQDYDLLRLRRCRQLRLTAYKKGETLTAVDAISRIPGVPKPNECTDPENPVACAIQIGPQNDAESTFPLHE